MKIAIDGRFYGIEHTGIGRYTINLVKHLQEIDKKNKYIIILRKKYFNSLKFPDNWSKELLDVRHYTIREQFRLLPILLKHKPDVFHSLQLNVPYLYFGNQVVTIHDTTQLSTNTKATTLPLPLYYMKLLAIQFSFRKALMAKKIIVPTNAVKADLAARGGKKEKIKVIYEGFDSLISSNAKKKTILEKYGLSDKYFLYVGNAYPHKNLKRAIDTIQIINNKQKEKVNFAIVCSRSEFTSELETYIKKQNAQNLVKLLGYVSDTDLHALYRHSVALFYPSKNEGFGLPGLEAMAAGTIVAASDISVFKEVFGNAALYFDPHDTNEMAEVLASTLELSSKKRKEYLNRGKQNITRFSWRKMAQETLEVYEAI